MAKLSSVEKNNRRKSMNAKSKKTREALKTIIADKGTSMEERLTCVIKLSEFPRNSSRVRIRNRCEISGRARGFHRRFAMSRIALRDLGSQGLIPGLTKSSW